MKTINAKKLHVFGVDFLKAYGASQDNAVIITDHLVDNDLKGIEAHGAMRLFEYAKFMVDGKLDGAAQPVVTEKTPGAFLVDGNRGFGIVALKRATEKLIETLETQPMAVAGIKGVGHTGRIGAYSEAMAAHGCFGCVYGGGGHKEHPSVAPFGGRKGVLSTNPTAMAMPGMDGVPLSADFATASSAGGKLRLALRKGVQLPEGQILDKNGNPSTDPAAYFDGGVMLPSAGAKGTGMGMINELLCYGLLGDPVEFNWFMTGVKLSVLCDKADYDRRTREFLEKVNAIPPAPGFQSVTYPGQFEARRAAQRAVSGVTVDDNIAAKLVEMAHEKGLGIPAELL